ncbi:MAG: hydroxyacylglutathione hydrolase, partial [Thermoleophilales bacterium]|nr:hydroxyacylglutathione hydrolase [Thermoleophilales bacterium]
MRQLADGLYMLRGFPPNAINVYLAGGVLIDSGSRHAARRILSQVKGQSVTAHALTHSHPDHDGSSKEVCDRLQIPLWVGEADVDPMENGRPVPDHPMPKLSLRAFGGPRRAVDRALREGDDVGGFTVLETPGHCAGHVSYWRAADRVLVLGDVLANFSPSAGLGGLREPPRLFSPDP